MVDDDLVELSRLAVSRRQFAIAIVLAVVFGPLVGWATVMIGRPAKAVAGAVIIAMMPAMAIAMRIRTPPDRFPTLRALRERPQDVAYIIAIRRGKDVLAIATRDGALLAKPIVLKANAELATARTADAILASQTAQMNRAVTIISRLCPAARTTQISDVVGLTSYAKLAKKAIAALPA